MPDYNDAIVNSTPIGATYSPFAPTVASLADGRSLIAWVSYTPDEFQSLLNAEIRARWIGADGVPLGDDFVVNSTTDGYQWRPSATATADGHVFLAWESGEGGDGDGVTVRGTLLGPDQTVMEDIVLPGPRDILVDYQGTDNQFEVKTTALADGRLFAVWSSFDGTDGDGFAIRGGFFAADGSPLGTDFVVNATGAGVQTGPAVLALSDGRILVTFQSTGTENTLMGRFIGADGLPAGDDFVVNSTPLGYAPSADVASLSDQRELVVWYSSGLPQEDPTGGNPTFGPGEIRGRVIGEDGQPSAADFVINSTGMEHALGEPAVATLADGTILVVWYSGDGGDGDWGVLRGRMLNQDGEPLAADFVVNRMPLNTLAAPDVAALPDGRVIVTWSSDEGSAMGAQTRMVIMNTAVDVAGTSLLLGDGTSDVLMGLGGNDSLMGRANEDSLMGGTGSDSISGGAGLDLLSAGKGADRLNGGAGIDTLKGGQGNDLLTGGHGDDTFIFALNSGDDVIADFAEGDRLVVTGWDGSIAELMATAEITDAGALLHLDVGTLLLTGTYSLSLVENALILG